MSTEHLNRPIGDDAVAIARQFEGSLNELLRRAFDAVGQLPRADERARIDDALSVTFDLAGIAMAKATAMLMSQFPDAAPAQIWQAAMVDLQMRAQATFDEFQEQLRRTVQ